MPITLFYSFLITFADATSRNVGDVGAIDRFYHIIESPQHHWTVFENQQTVDIADAQHLQLAQLLATLPPLPDPAVEPIIPGSDGTWVTVIIQQGDQQLSYRWWSRPPDEWDKLAIITQFVQQIASTSTNGRRLIVDSAATEREIERMARTVKCPAGQWTAIFDHAFVQLPRAWTVSFAVADGGVVAGEVIEKRSSWIFPNPPITRPLAAVMSFQRGWWNTFYSVHVKPTYDVVAHIR